MRARAVITLGIAGLVALFVAAHFGGETVMPSYLAVWLFVLAVPLGALPLVMGHDLLLDRPDTPLVAALRGLLTLMPLAALLAIPVLLDPQGLFPSHPAEGVAAAWAEPSIVLGRGIVLLLVWVGFAMAFRRPPRPVGVAAGRRALAGLGLGLHLVMGTLAAFDWIGAVEPGLNASGLGLLLLLAQSGTALSVAWLAAAARGEAVGTAAAPAMLILFGAWMFMQFTQYLVVWSANLPDEVVWYLHRQEGIGRLAEWAAAAVFLLALVLLPAQPGPRVTGAFAAAILAVHLGEMLWLVVPTSRSAFSFTLADALAIIGLVALLFGAVPAALRSVIDRRGLDRGPA